ncbi:protein IQ-DOMAIN 1 [Cynara cardunculus var. scolymus]|uniref:IQ motif, EF-hand binding site-containing protein n=1 Tax=Cynara cardunculus var. scolymus TaxID=59895 RepID=A0A103XUA6_CYNCS|nr:protein IQ-DOMAIN 1 [Cynara cardunculus var. scolymus]KVH97040.1 IQ motif, EF-hand binding site-containing protein [Cynara cardunculus var. scolymus]
MGSGDWLKNIISLNKARKQKSSSMKESALPEINRFVLKSRSLEKPTNIANAYRRAVGRLAEDTAAIQIQTAFRAFKARKLFFNLKRLARLQMLMEGDFGKKQTSNTLRNLQSWSKIQAQIRTRRLSMVEDCGIKQKKLENQLRLDAKAHDLEVEWSGGSHTMVETLARMKQREEATVKRERAMAYAFSHQWRANSNTNLLPNDSEVATSNWGWSWMERWIAARPWESRALVVSTPKKVNNSPSSKKSPSIKKSNSLKTSPNSKKTPRNRRLSYGSTAKVEDVKSKLEKQATK